MLAVAVSAFAVSAAASRVAAAPELPSPPLPELGSGSVVSVEALGADLSLENLPPTGPLGRRLHGVSTETGCPRCSRPLPPGALECPACGVVLAKLGHRSARPRRVAEDGVWRAGPILVMRRQARLPTRCVRCGELAATRVRKVLTWLAPPYYLALLIHVLVYIGVAAIALQRVELEIPLCAWHRRRRRRWMGIGVALMVAAVALVAVDLLLRWHPGLLLVAVGVFGIGLITTGLHLQVVVPRKIDDEHIWLEKVCPEYLDRLPDAPDHLVDQRTPKPPPAGRPQRA